MSARAPGPGSNIVVAGLPGTRLDARERERLRALEPAGVILFARNVEHEAQVLGLTRSIRDVLPSALVLIDQEGGRVDRLRAIHGRSPSARELAERGVDATRGEARRTAFALSSLGVDFNCAPVVDLDEGNERNGIGDRSFGADAMHVAALAAAVIDAHAEAGIATCLKHFPGLGRTGEDTHAVRPAVVADLGALSDRELVPFRLLRGRAPAVMVSHAAFPTVTGSDEPASLSRQVIEGLLRHELHDSSLVVSDDLEMGAVTDFTPGERAIRAMAAGCDLLLFCGGLDRAEEAREALDGAVAGGRLPAARLVEARARVESLQRWCRREAAKREGIV